MAIATYLRALLVPRHRLALECAALRQQLAVFKRKQHRAGTRCPLTASSGASFGESMLAEPALSCGETGGHYGLIEMPSLAKMSSSSSGRPDCGYFAAASSVSGSTVRPRGG